MKTTREILLEQHRQADRLLAEIQAQVIRGELGEREQRPWPAFVLQKLWTELFQPLRYAWGGFAAVWLVLWLANWQMSDHRTMTVAERKGEANAVIFMAWKEQEAALVELAEPRHQPVADRPRNVPPKPQSRRESVMSIG